MLYILLDLLRHINVLGFLYPAGPVPPGDSEEAALSRPIPTIAGGAVPGARWLSA